MPIKFTCPHCKRAMIVNDSLAGKKGRCKACQQILTVPKPANAKPIAPGPSSNAPAAPKSAPPPPLPADVEAEAAALFADAPKTEEPAEVKTIDLNCPFCDEAIQFSADLAGKRAPCPECKHIIKVPELVKKEPKDWRKADQRGPAGARLPDQPAPEGAWGSATAGKVGRDTLEKVGVIPKVKPPRTFWQKARWPLAGVSAVVLLAGFGWGGYRWWSGQTVTRALKEALDYAASPQSEKEVGKPGQAELFLGAGTFYLQGKKGDSAVEANKQFGKALTTLQPAPPSSERDAVLTDYALALVDLAGGPAEVAEGRRLSWDEIQKRLGAALPQIRDLDGRRAALRAVSRRLIARDETSRVLTLVSQAYSAPDDEKAAALCVVAWELLQAKDEGKAQRAVEDALKLYDAEKPPPVRAEVVALGLLFFKDKVPKLPEKADENQKANERVGQVVAMALKDEKWDEARKKANASEGDTKFRALLALAAAAVDLKSADAAGDVEAAANAVEKASNKSELSWSLLRLTELALTAGLPEERVQSLTESIPDRSLRGRAQLAIFRARLERSQQPIDESALDKIESQSLARVLAVQELARHNTRLDNGWAKTVQGWEQPRKAFGSLGAALGIQDRSGK